MTETQEEMNNTNTLTILPTSNNLKQGIKLAYVEKNQSINNKKDGNQKATNIKSLSTVPFNKESINNLKMKHIDIINTKQELIDRIKNVLNNRTEQKNFTIGALSENTKARIERDVQQDLFKNNQYSLIMNDEYLRHIEKHFKTIEEIADEVINLFDMVNNYDTVELETELSGTKRKLIFEKSYLHADIRTIEVVSNNNNSLNLISVYYTKKNRNQINQRIASTKGSNGMLDLIPASTGNNTINLPKSQIALLPNNINIQKLKK